MASTMLLRRLDRVQTHHVVDCGRRPVAFRREDADVGASRCCLHVHHVVTAASTSDGVQIDKQKDDDDDDDRQHTQPDQKHDVHHGGLGRRLEGG